MVFIILEVIYADKVDDFHTCCDAGSDFCFTEEENVPKYGELANIFRICSLSILSLISDISFGPGFDHRPSKNSFKWVQPEYVTQSMTHSL